jgi:SAM-dependent methyltransferase
MILSRHGPPALLALAAQAGGVFAVLAIVAPLGDWLGRPPGALLELAAMGGVAAWLGHVAGLPRWWLPINLSFVPLLAVVLAMKLPPLAFLVGFLLLAALYWPVLRHRVPLYLTGRQARTALLELLPAGKGLRFVDLGAGTGRLLAGLARARPGDRHVGIESAPLPWLAGWFATRGLAPGVAWRFGDFWKENLGEYDIIYAYLSPAPMPRLLAKLRAEMRPDALFISNTFPLPGVVPATARGLGDVHGSTLYVYGREDVTREKVSPP